MDQMTPPPTDRPKRMAASRIYELIMTAAERQYATAEVALPIRDAGLDDAFLALMSQIAANAANPIADLLEDAMMHDTQD